MIINTPKQQCIIHRALYMYHLSNFMAKYHRNHPHHQHDHQPHDDDDDDDDCR